MPKLTAESVRLKTLKDFFRYFDSLEFSHQSAIIDSLTISRDLKRERQTKKPTHQEGPLLNGSDADTNIS